MRCLITTTIMTPLTVAITTTPSQEVISTLNQVIQALYQVQAGTVGPLHLHLQIIQPPPPPLPPLAVGLWFILMAAALRMVDMVPGLALVFIGVLTIPGRLHVNDLMLTDKISLLGL